MTKRRRTIGQVLSERVRYYREAAGLRQEDLAARTKALGVPMNRVTIAKIEGASRDGDQTRADNATLVDILVLAAALDVPPPLLFIPLGLSEDVELGNRRLHPHLFLDWVCGDEELMGLGKIRPLADSHWKPNALPIYLFRRLRACQEEAGRAESHVTALEDPLYVEHYGPNEDAIERLRRVFDARLLTLAHHLDVMAEAGITSLPAMPPEWSVRMAELRLEDENQ